MDYQHPFSILRRLFDAADQRIVVRPQRKQSAQQQTEHAADESETQQGVQRAGGEHGHTKQDQAHEIALRFEESSIGRQKDHPLWKEYSKNGNVAEGWAELMPQLKTAFELSRFSIYVTGLILFGVVALGIINALFMSLYERMYEFGVLLAVGTRKGALARMIVFEAGALAIVSAGAGIILGLVINYIFAKIGFDFTGSEFSGVTFRERLYPVMKLIQFIIYPVLVFIFTLVVSLYPAIYAARLTPVKAMRKAQ
jgi:ABC-type antimicrobial peptide transport system permease subunit